MISLFRKTLIYIIIESGIFIIPLALYILYSLLFIIKGLPGYTTAFSSVINILCGILTLLLLLLSVSKFFRGGLTRNIMLFVALFVVWGLSSYQLTSGATLDFSLVRDNIGISFSSEAFTVIATPFTISDFFILLFFTAASISLLGKLRFASQYSVKRTGVIFLFLWAVIVLLPVDRGDGFTMFVKSIINYTETPVYAGPVSGDYPYERDFINVTSLNSRIPYDKKKPNIFLILIESFNANFVGKKAPDGIDYTPNFNAMIREGIFIDRFYGNSIQTCKGQEAVFFSIIPSINGKLFVDYPDLKISGFPEILKENGYHTLFFQAYHNLAFDNTNESMKKAGFSEIRSYAEVKKQRDNSSIWGWGVEDGVFYERFFEVLDSAHEKNRDKPLFAALMTIGTHIPCDGMPAEKRAIYSDPENIKEKYSNALRLSDSQLPLFFKYLKSREYLKNSVIIITSDHSFPMKEHGIYNNEVCFYDEAFRIPFLLLWGGIVKPKKITGTAFSQVDIGPTILDIAGINRWKNSMVGASIFNMENRSPVYLVQPYNGKYLQALMYPYKYIRHLRSGKEYLFNLDADPDESKNIIYSDSPNEIPDKLKKSIDAIYLNQKLIDSNRIRH